jgi:hypothetical protein
MEPSKQQVVVETNMHKYIIGLMVIFFLGDPGMETIAWLGDMKNYVITAAIALVSMPFIISQLDG